MPSHEKIDYIEWPSTDLAATKQFFTDVFQWQFMDYGPEYTAFDSQGMTGGFYQSTHPSLTAHGSALVIFYSDDLEQTLRKITDNSGKIIKPIFSFPGGRRFHFIEPGGNELAVWSDH
ncbi:VOC family protein [Parendozoicomonas haliclonae]|uniref:Glyoxalase-like domain protein n=1 Tax=Parendozoicomonas haliclonae TaxID=1960125 RepID=A0A1X7AKE2_9GAMM|nr:VOC family protein [Parendozoicomonas haliclonae]SMA47688.1 Glyoxalase-like domain protein [Parendozoicomonas haliclonae]